MPKAVSNSPPKRTLPAIWIGIVPRDRPRPNSWKKAAPFSKITGTVASEITLLTTVGLPNSPSIAGSGGLARTTAALALQRVQEARLLAADIGAGADPHLHVEGAPRAEHRRPEQPRLAARCRSPRCITSMASGYSERM